MQHGRSGAPKEKLVRYHEDTRTLQWLAPGHQGSSSNGSILKRFFSSSSATTDNAGIPLDDIVAVRKGVQSEVLQRAGLLDPHCCLSIVTKTRTLDLQLPNTLERNKVFRGLKSLVGDRIDVEFI